MNQTRNAKVARMESAFAFITAQVDDFNRKTFLKRKREKAVAKRLVSTATAIVMTVISVIPLHAAETVTPVVSEPQPVFETSLKLDSQNYSLLAIENSTIEIKPGKSLAQEQEEARLRELAKRQQMQSVATSIITSRGAVERVSADEAHRMAQEAAAKAGIPNHWKELAAIWQVESGKTAYGCYGGMGGNGPMQFNPSTFRAYQADGDGDGTADMCNAKDALVAAGNLLKRGGIDQGNVDGAIHNYNHSMAYVNKVKAVASTIQ